MWAGERVGKKRGEKKKGNLSHIHTYPVYFFDATALQSNFFFNRFFRLNPSVLSVLFEYI